MTIKLSKPNVGIITVFTLEKTDYDNYGYGVSRYAKRNIIAAASLMAGLAALSFSGTKALEIFPKEVESALSENPENKPHNLPYEQRNAAFVAGIGFFALAVHQRVKHVAETSLTETKFIDEKVEPVSYYHQQQLSTLVLQLFDGEIEAEAEVIKLNLDRSKIQTDLADVIDLNSRRRDPPPTQPPINPDFTSVA